MTAETATLPLRLQAEAALNTLEPPIPMMLNHLPDNADSLAADMQKLLHELQVHQVELHMQNNELQRARHETERALARYTRLYDFAPVGYFTLDRRGVIFEVNLVGAALLQMVRSKLLGRRFGASVAAGSRLLFRQFLERVFTTTSKERCEVTLHAKGDGPLIVEIEAVMEAATEQCLMVVADISERKQAEESLKLAGMVYQAIGEAIMVADANNRILAINPAFTNMTGYMAQEAIGQSTNLLKSGRQDVAFYRDMWNVLNTTGHWQGEIWNRRRNGEIYPEWLTISTIYDLKGEVLRRVAMFSDISDKKRAEELIWRQANYDTLTTLPNRRLFHDRLEQEIVRAQRTGQSLALLFIDLDHFKEVNDTLGHAAGDRLLEQSAKRIVSAVRATDTVARLGGDEFTVILDNLLNSADVERVVQAILLTHSSHFLLGDEVIFTTASIGVAFYPTDATDVANLLKCADQAMYRAKSAGRNRASYFVSALQEESLERMLLLRDLHGALAAGEFSLWFQPIINMVSGKIEKAEALLRWHHPRRGMVSPAVFIPLAEESGLIHEIGDWVFREAARWTGHWNRIFPAGIEISVNVSPVQFQAGGRFVGWLDYLVELAVPGEKMVIEITEGLLLHAGGEINDMLRLFGNAGLKVAIDDFGTGYSALSYLKKFHVDYLKIDQFFVRNLPLDASNLALSEAIILMAHKLGIQVIAEGVEDEEQRNLLHRFGCDYAQGYLYAKPMPAQEFEALLCQWSVVSSQL